MSALLYNLMQEVFQTKRTFHRFNVSTSDIALPPILILKTGLETFFYGLSLGIGLGSLGLSLWSEDKSFKNILLLAVTKFKNHL